MSAKIQSIEAREIMAERGTLGLEVVVTTDTGAVGALHADDGRVHRQIRGRLRPRWRQPLWRQGADARPCRTSAQVTPHLIGMEVKRQREIDELLIQLDGTPNKSKLGANAIVGISLAVCKAAANAAELPLYQYIGGANACIFPMPIFGICLCGRYRDPGKTRWLKPSYEIIPYGATGFESAVEMAYDIQRAFTRLVVDRYGINVYRQQSLENSYSAFWMPGVDQGRPRNPRRAHRGHRRHRQRGHDRHLLRRGGGLLLRSRTSTATWASIPRAKRRASR